MRPLPLQIARVKACSMMSLTAVSPSKNAPRPLTNKTKPPSVARFSALVQSAKHPMLAGRPNPNDTPKRSDTTKTLRVLVEFALTKISEEIIPNTIQIARKVSFLRALALNAAPTIAESIVPVKWTAHIAGALSSMSPFKVLKASEYHIKALDIRMTFASADLVVIPDFVENLLLSICVVPLKLFALN